MQILIIDGQGGRMGKTIIELLRQRGLDCEIIAIGTNAVATSAMLKAGADRSATGENPVAVVAATADVIAGPVGILIANSLLGEISARMAYCVATSRAQKVLIPVNKCGVIVAGTRALSMNDYIESAVDLIAECCVKATGD